MKYRAYEIIYSIILYLSYIVHVFLTARTMFIFNVFSINLSKINCNCEPHSVI